MTFNWACTCCALSRWNCNATTDFSAIPTNSIVSAKYNDKRLARSFSIVRHSPEPVPRQADTRPATIASRHVPFVWRRNVRYCSARDRRNDGKLDEILQNFVNFIKKYMQQAQ
ncbi:hypothetical protein [Xanthomonas sp. MUS 060]|uniref:hypothetical protein n=1 Tax=Xanthomonas sp. MUS 060 TaxID=1588031 RepID=UPI00137931B5|nr:hypothetical protein [Xanthomonas sp. MUS 060]